MEKLDSVTLDSATQLLLNELTGMKDQFEDQLKSRISDFEERVMSVRYQLEYLHSQMDDLCSDDQSMNPLLNGTGPWFQMYLLLGSFMDNPYSNKDQVCG